MHDSCDGSYSGLTDEETWNLRLREYNTGKKDGGLAAHLSCMPVCLLIIFQHHL
jgi:hypothetical protein